MSRLYIPPDLENKLTQENKTLSQAGSIKQVTVMFVDLRGFSHILEKRDVRRVFKILDIYFRMIVSISAPTLAGRLAAMLSNPLSVTLLKALEA